MAIQGTTSSTSAAYTRGTNEADNKPDVKQKQSQNKGKDVTTDNGQPKTPTAPSSNSSTAKEIPPHRIDLSKIGGIISTLVGLLSGGIDVLEITKGIKEAVSRDFTTNPLTAEERTKYALTPEETKAAKTAQFQATYPDRDYTKNPVTDAELADVTLSSEFEDKAIQQKVTAGEISGKFAGLDTLFETIFGAGNSLTQYIQNNGGDVTALIADIALSITTGKPLSPKSVGLIIGAVGLVATELLKSTGLDKEIQALLTKAGLTQDEAKSVTDFLMGASLLIASGVLGGDMTEALDVAGLSNTLLSILTTLTKDGGLDLSLESAQKLLAKLDSNNPENILPDLQNLINSVLVLIQKMIAAPKQAVEDSAPQEDFGTMETGVA